MPPLFEQPVIGVLAPASDIGVSVSRHSPRSRKRGAASVPGVPPLFEQPVIDVWAPACDIDVSESRHSSRSRKRGAASTPVQSKKLKKKGTSVTKKKSKKRAVSSRSDAGLLTLFKAFAQQQGWALPSEARHLLAIRLCWELLYRGLLPR